MRISDWSSDVCSSDLLTRFIEGRRKAVETGEGVDWSFGEALAFGALLFEGDPVRLSGQDSGRGTFSQRHSVYIDQVNEERYVPLNHVQEGQAQYEVIDRPLYEAGVPGFAYGYSQTEPNALVLWEAGSEERPVGKEWVRTC